MNIVKENSIATYKDYIQLCKPRVVLLMILTSLVGMYLAPANLFSIKILLLGNLGIALVASAAAVINHAADYHIDKLMGRTKHRPIVKGKISVKQSLLFSMGLCLTGMLILIFYINTLTAILTFLSLMGYAVCYTFYLKHATPQNIVIGGIAGAMPPLLGWTAVTGDISPNALLLVLIIFLWTPPHFWALAIYRKEDYEKANVPMLPFTHGIKYTKLNIIFYTALLTCASLLPFLTGMSQWIYLIGTSLIDFGFLYYAIHLFFSEDKRIAIATFWYSIIYLGILFILLLVDHLIR